MMTVTSTASFAAKWLVPLLDRFRARHSGIDVRIDASDRLVNFARGEAQGGIRFGNGVYPGLRSDLLSEELVFPVCSPTRGIYFNEPTIAIQAAINGQGLALERQPGGKRPRRGTPCAAV